MRVTINIGATDCTRPECVEAKRRLANGVRIVGVCDGGQYQEDWQTKRDAMDRAASLEKVMEAVRFVLADLDGNADYRLKNGHTLIETVRIAALRKSVAAHDRKDWSR